MHKEIPVHFRYAVGKWKPSDGQQRLAIAGNLHVDATGMDYGKDALIQYNAEITRVTWEKGLQDLSALLAVIAPNLMEELEQLAVAEAEKGFRLKEPTKADLKELREMLVAPYRGHAQTLANIGTPIPESL